VKIKRLSKGVVLSFSDAEVGDLLGVMGRLDVRRLVSKRELALVLKLSGIAETISGRRSVLTLSDEQRKLPGYEAAARAARGLWQTVRV
jgi:hypothetical protein